MVAASTERGRQKKVRESEVVTPSTMLGKPGGKLEALVPLGPPPATLIASRLAPLLNDYTIDPGPPRTIVVSRASELASLQDITVSGTLLKKQFVTIDPKTDRRSAVLASKGGSYTISSGDGDLHFCLGDVQLQPHIACELQNAKAWLSKFNQAVGKQLIASGFFRCLFEHPGFNPKDDAHIFEIHPVRAVSLDGQIQAFNVDIPEQKSIHTWTKPRRLNVQDGHIKVSYDKAADKLTFVGMDGMDENYVSVKGAISGVKLNATGGPPASFTLTAREIGYPIHVYCLQGTTVARQLRQLKRKEVTMVALRNIDLAQALLDRYVINLLAIDIKA